MNSDRSYSQKKRAKFLRLLFISALLMALSPWSSLIGLHSQPSMALAAKNDKSDMNGDEVVDLADLQLFSEQRGLDWMNTDWCQWIEDNSKFENQYAHLFDFIREYYACGATVPILSDPTASEVNIPMVTLGATIVNDGGDPVFERGTMWNTTGPPVTQNQLAEGGTASGPFTHVRSDFTGVEIGTRIYFRAYAVNSVGTGYSPASSFVVEGPLTIQNTNERPARLALGYNGNLYVSDGKVGSVFIYDANLQVTGELKGLDSPLGVAVDSAGNIYAGNSRLGRIEKYSSQGQRIANIGQEMIRMPTDLTLDRNDNLYVADLESNVVWVFTPAGALLRTIRKGGLKAPVAVEVAYHDDGAGQQIGELFVADKGNYLVKVFDLQGNLLRSFGGFPTKGGMMGTTWYWQGKFISLQSLAVDALGRLHALDIYMNRVQILDPITGAYIADYGQHGSDPGQLKLPLDIIISDFGEVIVANADNKRVEIIYTTP